MVEYRCHYTCRGHVRPLQDGGSRDRRRVVPEVVHRFFRNFTLDTGVFAAIAAPVLYLTAGGFLAAGLWTKRSAYLTAAIVIALGATFAHGVFLIVYLPAPGGIDANLFNSLSLVSLLIVLVLLLAEIRVPVIEIGIVAFPGAALCLILQQTLAPGAVVLTSADPIIAAHVFASLLAYSVLSIAAANAALIAIQDAVLRRHRGIRLLEMLPPLTVMENLLFKLVLVGWLILTLGLITGILFIDNLLAQHLVHKTVLSVVAWITFGLLLAGRWRFGWRGMTAVWLTLAGMFLLILAYFGSKLVLELILGRDWLLDGAPPP